MSYRDFTLKMVEQRFGLSVAESPNLFAEVPEVEAGQRLKEMLAETVALAIDINTEKARSELIIAPVLLEVRALLGRRISLFSGVTFDVDPGRGLNGVCDFLLSRSSRQLYVSAPVAVVVEAKNEDMRRGIGQCLAAMLSARLYNDNEGTRVDAVFGAVTTGTNWRFLRLVRGEAEVDGREYSVQERLGKILGIFVQMFPAEGDAGRPGRESDDAGSALVKDH